MVAILLSVVLITLCILVKVYQVILLGSYFTITLPLYGDKVYQNGSDGRLPVANDNGNYRLTVGRYIGDYQAHTAQYTAWEQNRTAVFFWQHTLPYRLQHPKHSTLTSKACLH